VAAPRPAWVTQVQWSLFISAAVALGAAGWLAYSAPKSVRVCHGACGYHAHASEVLFLLIVAVVMVVAGALLPALSRRAERGRDS
jgi:hypothetical protein